MENKNYFVTTPILLSTFLRKRKKQRKERRKRTEMKTVARLRQKMNRYCYQPRYYFPLTENAHRSGLLKQRYRIMTAGVGDC